MHHFQSRAVQGVVMISIASYMEERGLTEEHALPVFKVYFKVK